MIQALTVIANARRSKGTRFTTSDTSAGYLSGEPTCQIDLRPSWIRLCDKVVYY